MLLICTAGKLLLWLAWDGTHAMKWAQQATFKLFSDGYQFSLLLFGELQFN
jgi:hypothetical protein